MAVPIMEDGFPTTISFTGINVENEGDPQNFCVKSLTPPAYVMGGANDVSCMSNTAFRTKASKKLIAVADITVAGYYNAALYTDLLAQLGVNQEIVITFPPVGGAAAQTLTLYGFLDSFTPGNHEEGSAPEATLVIVVSNRDANGDEIAPSIGSVSA